MKIVSKTELMAMPKGTPFADYHPNGSWPAGPEMVFVAPCGYIDDFYFRSINNPDWGSSEQLVERRREMDADGTAYPLDVSVDREAYYDPDTRYVVWEPDDVARIIHLLQGGDDPNDED